MEDYKRFFRYVIPGLIFMIEVFIYLLLSAFDKSKYLIKTYWLNADVSVPISGLFVATGIGYLFGVIYHNLFHLIRNWKCSESLIADHLSLVQITLNGSEIIDRWKDPSDGTQFSLAKLDLTAFKDTLDKAKELNSKVRDYVKENAEKAHDEL
ncbi:MAG: hypothetical protein AAB257_00655, partial [Nitrospinota bacterium]